MPIGEATSAEVVVSLAAQLDQIEATLLAAKETLAEMRGFGTEPNIKAEASGALSATSRIQELATQIRDDVASVASIIGRL